MKSKSWIWIFLLVLLSGGAICCPGFSLAVATGGDVWHLDMERVERGRYLARIAGCNDCHTEGYLQSEGMVPEDQWLTGSGFGWRGPWGTTYASNLRLFVNTLAEDQWIAFVRQFKARPPMPWYNLNRMSDVDLQAIYHFIRYQGPAGQPAPDYLPPNREPTTPYALFPSPPK